MSTLATSPSFAATPTPSFDFNDSDSFCFLHVTDIQERSKFNERSAEFLRYTIQTEKPRLMVLTGDNTDSTANHQDVFLQTIRPFIAVARELNVPFAVTFGNHDSEKQGEGFYTRQELYDLYKKEAGDLFIDYDVPALSGVGNGKIQLTAQGQPVMDLFIMDSGAYAPPSIGGYDGVKTDQIQWFEENTSVPCLWFQHIIVPDVNTTGILLPTSEAEKEQTKLNHKINPERTTGEIKENTCPPKWAAYQDADHTYQGRTLYQSWLKMGTMKGAYFGHDHMNTFEGTDTNGIKMATSKSITLHSYNDKNPGLRIFTVKKDGSFTTRTSTEADMKAKLGQP